MVQNNFSSQPSKGLQGDRASIRLSPFILYCGFLSFLGFGVLNPLLPTLVRQYGGTAWEVGLLYATFSFAQFLTLPGIGALSDARGRRTMMLISLLGATLGYFLFASGATLGIVFLGWAIVGLTDGVASTVFATIADTTTPQQRTRAFSWVSAAIALGLIVGPIVSGILSRLSLVAPVYFVAIAFLMALVWGYFAMPETLPQAQRSHLPNWRHLNPFTQLRISLTLPHVQRLIASFFLVNLAMFALISNLPALANERFGWTPEQIAPLFALFGFVSVLTQAIVIPKLIPRFGEIRLVVLGTGLASSAFVVYSLFPLSGSAVFLYVGSILVGLGQPIAETALTGLISTRVGASLQGRINSSLQTIQALARVIAPLVAGWLYQSVHPITPYGLGAIAMLLAGFAVQHVSKTLPKLPISGNTVLITGGSSGIGLAFAKQFLQTGNRVIITGRNTEKLANVQADYPEIITEVTDMEDLEALQKLANRYPDVNILINNAGVQYNYEFVDPTVPIELIETELKTNLIAPLQLIKLMLPQLLMKPKAAIVNVSSGLGLVPKQTAPVYCGSKAGLHIATKALRWQLEATSVKVFEVIAPLVDTPMTAGRGKGKITPDALVDEFWDTFGRVWYTPNLQHHYEIPIGKVKLLLVLQRWLPQLAEKILRPGL